jgi:hypothetical protein
LAHDMNRKCDRRERANPVGAAPPKTKCPSANASRRRNLSLIVPGLSERLTHNPSLLS